MGRKGGWEKGRWMVRIEQEGDRSSISCSNSSLQHTPCSGGVITRNQMCGMPAVELWGDAISSELPKAV